ncbi:peptidoglycan editing factor PgeF [Halioxenophilus aromaticivorans]|uniref:Purine nucleoside phosphorylase n=1 Tax=Halioxenophilus aromaticivorans TaxID=1306992 RepID=A0AAV3U8C9_9ALTE
MPSERVGDGFWQPDWPVPANVGVLLTDRSGGGSAAPYVGLNLALHVGDDAQTVAANRERLQTRLGTVKVQWLEQVHGTKVATAAADGAVRTADAAVTRDTNLACAVMTADCLPVLLCDQGGTVVAAAHAGWRGLVDGVIANTVASMAVPATQITAFLGPAISQAHFEVGIEVVEAVFALATTNAEVQAVAKAVTPGARALHFYLDLYAVARVQLAGLGITSVYGGEHCTYGDARFFSYRRQKVTGRQASLIWLQA